MYNKEYIMSTGIFEDNDYFDRYYELISTNSCQPAIKTQTQSHHIIPKSYYKHSNLAIDNSCDNIVNLKHYQHILAHWYLYKCSKADWFTYSNAYALLYMLRIHKLPDDEDEIVTLAINYGEVYSDFCRRQSEKYKGKPNVHIQGRIVSDETRKKLSASHKGLIQSDETKRKRKETLLRMYANNEIDKSVSEETKEKLRQSIQGRKWVNNGKDNKQVRAEELPHFIEQGWTLGMFLTEEQHKKRSDKQQGHVVTEETRRKMQEAAKNRLPMSEETRKKLRGKTSPMKGKHHTEETKIKISQAMKGRPSPNKGKHLSAEMKKRLSDAYKENQRIIFWITNGVEQKRLCLKNIEDADNYFLSGWVRGTLKQLEREEELKNAPPKNPKYQTTLGMKQINNGEKSKMVPKEELDEYIKNGWKVGRIKHETKSSS